MLGADHGVLLWHIVFGRGDQAGWWHPDWSHCFAFGRDQLRGAVLFVDSSDRCLVVRWVGADREAAIWRYVKSRATCCVMIAAPDHKRKLRKWPLTPFNCVTICRDLAGVEGHWFLTPRGLARRLVGAGGLVIKGETP